jgi:hypothetical protein
LQTIFKIFGKRNFADAGNKNPKPNKTDSSIVSVRGKDQQESEIREKSKAGNPKGNHSARMEMPFKGIE